MDLVSLSALAVSLVALVVSGIALTHDWFSFQNPVLRAELAQPIGTIYKDTNTLASGLRGWYISFTVFGPGAAYLPRVKVDRVAPAPTSVHWWISHKDRLLTASEGELTIVIDEHVRHDGLWVVVSYEVPRRLRRGTKTMHIRVPVPKNGSNDRRPTEVYTFRKWRPHSTKAVHKPPMSFSISPLVPPRDTLE